MHSINNKILSSFRLAVSCLSEASAVAVLAIVGFVFFVLPNNAYASTFFTNVSTYTVSGTPSSPATIGSFVPYTNVTISSTTPLSYDIKNTSGFPTCSTGMYVSLSDSPTSNVNSINRQTFTTSTTSTAFIHYSGSFNGTKALTGGTTYYIRAYSQCNPGNFEIKNVNLGDAQSQVTLDAYNFTGSYLTRFLNATVSGPRTAVVFNVDYWLNLLEYTATNRPDYITVTSAVRDLGSDNQVDVTTQLILPLTQGTSTKAITSAYNFVNNKNYISTISFWNINQQTNTFSRSAITLTFSITGNVVSNVTVLSNSNGIKDALVNASEYEICPFMDFGCGIRNSAKYLFVPSRSSLDQMKTVFSSSSIPWVASAYKAFTFSSTYVQSGQSADANTYQYNMVFDSNGKHFDFKLFALSDVTSYISPYGSTTRPIALTMLIIMFLYMVYQSINNIITLTYSKELH